VRHYGWEPWHYGFTAGPPPCSPAGDRAGVAAPGDPASGGDGVAAAEGGLPSFVPARFRDPLAVAAARWNVSASLLAAQLLAESNFNPYAVSAAGAAGIAQFMPATAASYGLRDPFNAGAAIDAQAHLMSDLLERFGGAVPLALAAYNAGPGAVSACSCVPAYAETQAYVARIMGLMTGAGAIAAPALDIRLVD
jgi:soluble lytic murein transglycosylase-like protein